MNRLFLLLFGAVSLVAHAQVPDYVPTEGLVAWYPFNGNANDESGNGNDGIAVDVESAVDRFGNFNEAFFFSSEGCQPRVDAQVDMTTVQSEMTFSFWMSRSGDGCISPRVFEILGSDGAYLQASVSDNSLFFGFGGGIGAPEPIQNNSWYHMLIAIGGNGFCTFYQNGEVVDSGVITPSGMPMDVSKLNGDIAIGRMNHSAWDAFHGVIDDVALWNRILTNEEIQGLYNGTAPIPGCTDSTACNFDSEATSDDGSCIPSGCMEPLACNYNALAECEGEACDYSCCPGPGCCGNGMYWDYETSQCAIIETCQDDLDGDGVIGVNDLMQLLSSFGTDCAPAEEPETAEFTCGDPVSYHGYDYATVQIGEQCWFAENLRTEFYQNGDGIPLVLNDIDWDNIDGDAARCSAAANAHPNAGQLYTFFVVSDERGVCPSDWHVPSHEEWIVLELDLGLDPGELENWGESRGNLGLKMKSCLEWNGDCSMQSGFNAVYSSIRPGNGPENGDYSALEVSAFWSSTPNVGAWYRSLKFNSSGIHAWYDGDGGDAGFSIRCLKD